MFDITMATRSDAGQRETNEDALRTGSAGERWYAVLSDGAGGHERGAEAARCVVARVEAELCAEPGFAADSLTEALLRSHAELQREQIGAEGRRRMHATVVALWIDGRQDRALWSHVGDTRLYRFRYGVADFVTADDSVVQQLLLSGALTPSQARHHPLKSQLIAAVGMQEALRPHTVPEAVALGDGDVFLLCTDGWWDALSDTEMAASLGEAATPQDWLDTMHALIRERTGPSQDNFSAIAVWVSDPTQITQSMPNLD